MFGNECKTGFRSLWRQRSFSLINILGLAIGMGACILLFLFIHFEYSYDRFQAKSDRIYRAWLEQTVEGDHRTSALTPLPLGPALSANLAGVEAACRVYRFSSIVQADADGFNEAVHMVDPSVFQVFDFKGVQSGLSGALTNPGSVVISKTIARKYFGDADAVGKSLSLLLGDQKVPFIVRGVMEDAAPASSIRPAIMIPFSNDHYLWKEAMRTSRWFNVWTETYVLLKKGETVRAAEGRMPDFLKRAIGNDYSPGSYAIHWQPLTAIHMDPSLPQGFEPVSDPKYFYILSVIGGLILLLASINFITLSVGSSAKRATEVGVRKVLGAERGPLIRQFWGESFLITLISFVLGGLLAALLLPGFNRLVGRDLSLSFHFSFIGFCLLLVLVTGLAAGLYPALFLSRFTPVEVLKGKIGFGVHAGFFRKGLIVCQFVASIALIAGTLTVRRQLNYLRHTELGYAHKEHVLIIATNLRDAEGLRVGELYKHELLKLPEVASVSVSTYSLAETPWATIGYKDDENKDRLFQFNAADPDFLATMGIDLSAGKSFSASDPSDYASSVLVNETLVREYGIKNPVGSKLSGRLDQRIIGVMKDFHTESLHQKIMPLVMAAQADSIFHKADQEMFGVEPRPRVSVRLFPGNVPKQMEDLKKAWETVAAGRGFEYHFLDEGLARQYSEDDKTGTVADIASLLSIWIASMGLFGLTTLTVARRTREIGIRKVLGAGVPGILGLLSGDLLKLVLIAAVIAFPITWLAAGRWLQGFAYRVDMSGWIFVLAGLAAMVIAGITISVQALKAALANPVKSLRTE